MGNSNSIEVDDIESQNVYGSFLYVKSSLLNLDSRETINDCKDFPLATNRPITTPTLNRNNSLNYITKRRPSLEFYDSSSPKLQPFPSAQRISVPKRSHSESSVFRRRVHGDSNKAKLINGKRSFMQASKMRLDQLFKKSHSSSKKKIDVNDNQVVQLPVIDNTNSQPCVQCQGALMKYEWKEKLEKWAESLRQAIEIINREEKMRLFIHGLQSENSYLKNQLDDVNLEFNELKNKYDLFEHEAILERKRDENAGHLFCHHCMNNNHLSVATNSLCHLLDLDNLTTELNTILTCDKCCQTCQTIAGQLLKRLHF